MDKCDAVELLEGQNIKITRQRLSVLDFIISMDSPFCADDLHVALKNDMDLVTIYRNLILLCRKGILREVMNKNDRQYFEMACVHNPEHPHFFCTTCNKIYCLKAEKNFTVLKRINPGNDFIIHKTVLQYSGICPSCRR